MRHAAQRSVPSSMLLLLPNYRRQRTSSFVEHAYHRQCHLVVSCFLIHFVYPACSIDCLKKRHRCQDKKNKPPKVTLVPFARAPSSSCSQPSFVLRQSGQAHPSLITRCQPWSSRRRKKATRESHPPCKQRNKNDEKGARGFIGLGWVGGGKSLLSPPTPIEWRRAGTGSALPTTTTTTTTTDALCTSIGTGDPLHAAGEGSKPLPTPSNM